MRKLISKRPAEKKPKRRKMYHILWRVRGSTHGVSTGQWGAADQVIRAIACGADMVNVVTFYL